MLGIHSLPLATTLSKSLKHHLTGHTEVAYSSVDVNASIGVGSTDAKDFAFRTT